MLQSPKKQQDKMKKHKARHHYEQKELKRKEVHVEQLLMKYQMTVLRRRGETTEAG